MNTPGAKAYRPWTPELYADQAHAPSAKLPEDDLVFFVIDVVPKLDLSHSDSRSTYLVRGRQSATCYLAIGYGNKQGRPTVHYLC